MPVSRTARLREPGVHLYESCRRGGADAAARHFAASVGVHSLSSLIDQGADS